MRHEMNSATTRPNFFIAGAPKCGTSSLAAWLSEHPQVFMSSPKEPYYFNTDLNSCNRVDRNEYEALFAQAKPEHKAVGEATTHYLYSQEALTNILDYHPESRIIAMVRNPIDMAVSFHRHRLWMGQEQISDFGKAWNLQSERLKGRSIFFLCHDPEFLQYGSVCRLGEQIKRMFALVPREQRHVVVLDDLKENPLKEWKAVLRFLNVGDDGRTQFLVHNPARRIRFRRMRTATRTLEKTMEWTKEATGLSRFRLGLLKRVDLFNRREQPDGPISARLRAELAEYFRDDIGLLGELLERDFSEWLTLEDGSKERRVPKSA